MRRCLVLLLFCCMVFQTFNYTVVQAADIFEQKVTVEFAESTIQLMINAKPLTSATLQIIKPGKQLPKSNNTENLEDIFAFVKQVDVDAMGTAEVLCKLPTETGDYTVRIQGNDVSAHWYVSDDTILKKELFALGINPNLTSFSNIPSMIHLTKSDIDVFGIPHVANQIKNRLENMPEGKRAIFLGGDLGHLRLNENGENYIWWDFGVNYVRTKLEEFFKEYRRIDGKVDYFVSDIELGMGNFAIGGGNEESLARYKAIEKDPRYAEEIRPLLEERGFAFQTDPEKGELYDVCYYNLNGKEYHIWNAVMANRFADYVNTAVYEPAKAYYPNIKFSNYYGNSSDGWYKVPDSVGHKNYLGGTIKKAGTHSSRSLYGGISTLQSNLPEEYNRGSYELTPFHDLLHDQNELRDMMLSDKDGAIQPWVAYYSYDILNSKLGNTPYYTENILHTGLCNPDPYLFYVSGGDFNHQTNQSRILSAILNELNYLVGYEDRKTLVTSDASWNASYLISGMYAKGRNVWRITPDLSKADVTMQSFCVDTQTPTFAIAGQTITFPEGSIYRPADSQAPNGYWVITPENSYPVISYDKKSAELNPFQHDDFESYDIGVLPNSTAGAMWASSNNCAEVGFENGSGGNKVVSLTSNNGYLACRNLNFVKLVGKPAKAQTWEIRVKLPNVSENSAVELFNYGTEWTGTGGSPLRIAGDTIYHKIDGKYASIMVDNQKLQGGQWYRVKRAMDFTVEGVQKCSVYAYDESGTMVAFAENVVAGNLQPTGDVFVRSSQFKATGFATNEKVMLDDFKVYQHSFESTVQVYDKQNSLVAGSLSNKGLKLRYSYYNANTSNQPIDLYMAQYKGNALIDLSCKSFTAYAGADDVLLIDLPFKPESTRVSIFAWNGLHKLIPMFNSLTIND